MSCSLSNETIAPCTSSVTLAPGASGSKGFTITNNTIENDNIALHCAHTGAIASCSVPSLITVNSHSSKSFSVTYNAAATAGSGTVTITADGIATLTATISFTVAAPNAVAVTPKGQAVSAPALLPATQVFTVLNSGGTSEAYTFAAVCTGSVTSCSVTPSGATISAGLTTTATVSYTPGPVGSTATIQLIAYDATFSTPADTGSINETAINNGLSARPPLVDVASANTGTTVDKNLCLTIAAGPSAASECGALRIVHPLRSVRTLNKVRTPTLIYSSAEAQPLPIVRANITLDSLTSVPDTVVVVLKGSAGQGLDSIRIRGSAWGLPKMTRRVALRYDAISSATDFYKYTVEARSIYNGSSIKVASATSQLIVVNRSASEFGAGWWLAGLERLYLGHADTILWVGGDGSARVYTRKSATVFTAPNVDHPDSIAKVGTTYIRYLPQKLRVQFDATTGYHTATINRLGHTTLFGYSGGTTGLLTSITVPPGIAKKYTFSYTAGNKLDTISNPGPGPQGAGNSELRRRTRAVVSGNQLMSLRDCDNAPVCNGFESAGVIAFTYATGTNLIKSRSDRNGIAHSFFFDSLYQLSRDSLSLQSFGRTIVARFQNADSTARPTSLVANAIPVDSAYVRFDGPRALPIKDFSYFWLDRLGSPRKIRNAVGDTTVVTADAVWPGLAARIRKPSGQVVKAWYNSRALIDSITDSTHSRIVGTTRTLATNRIIWDPTFEAPVTITLPEGEVTHFTYDATTGNRLTQYAGPDTSRSVHYSYNTSGLLSAIKTPLVTRPQQFAYDAVLQNINSVLTPRGYPTTYSFDSLGRLTGTKSPIDSSKSLVHGLWLSQTTLYDALDRDTMTTTSSPAVADTMSYAGHRIVSTPAQTLTVTKQYDGNGNLLQHSTKASDASRAQIRQGRYDFANRPYQVVAINGRYDGLGYDESGNVIADTTRRGDVITSIYDAMNRLTTRFIPAVNPPGFTSEGRTFPQYGSVALAADTEVFAFDSGGSMIAANNANARITRQFNPDGSVSTDSIALNSFAGTRWDLHNYGLHFRYDLNGRRTLLQLPAKLSPQTVPGQIQDTMTYAYDGVFGQLAEIRDAEGGAFDYVYDKEGRIIETDAPNQVSTNYVYENTGDGQLKDLYSLSTPLCFNYTGGFIVVDPGWFVNDDIRYDGRGKAIEYTQPNTIPGFTVPTRTSYRYSALGAVVIADNDSVETSMPTSCTGSGIVDPRFANQFTLWHSDALGNILSTQVQQAAWYGTATGQTNNQYETATLELTKAVSANGGPYLDVFTDTSMYDEVGSRTYLHRHNVFTSLNHWEVSYYRANGRLYALDRQSDEDNDWWVAGGRFQYQYDALGRRVQTSTKLDPLCTNAACRAVVQRSIWDGNQLLLELRYPADSSNHWDIDTGLVANNNHIDYGHFGRVLYTNGVALDKPVGMVRMNYGPGPFFSPPVRLTPSWNWHGEAVTGSFDDRLRYHCKGGQYLTGADTSCIDVGWSGDVTVFERSQLVWTNSGVAPAWEGSVIRATAENSDQVYMRNRYYDPIQGRFTQEDPIGLAGGLNAYGFAGGDPVNFSDPFGLCAGESSKQERANRVQSNSEPCVNTSFTAVVAASFAATKEALLKVFEKLGIEEGLPKMAPGKWGSPQRGTSKFGYRLDPGHPNRPAGDPEEGPHINWWDWIGGKRGSGGRSGAEPIKEPEPGTIEESPTFMPGPRLPIEGPMIDPEIIP